MTIKRTHPVHGQTANSNALEETAHVVMVAAEVKRQDALARQEHQPQIQPDPALEPMPMQMPDAQPGVCVRSPVAFQHEIQRRIDRLPFRGIEPACGPDEGPCLFNSHGPVCEACAQ